MIGMVEVGVVGSRAPGLQAASLDASGRGRERPRERMLRRLHFLGCRLRASTPRRMTEQRPQRQRTGAGGLRSSRLLPGGRTAPAAAGHRPRCAGERSSRARADAED